MNNLILYNDCEECFPILLNIYIYTYTFYSHYNIVMQYIYNNTMILNSARNSFAKITISNTISAVYILNKNQSLESIFLKCNNIFSKWYGIVSRLKINELARSVKININTHDYCIYCCLRK